MTEPTPFRVRLLALRDDLIEASITVAAAISMHKLVVRAQQSDDPAAREMAHRVQLALQRPDRRVGAALDPKRRGGEPEGRPEQRADRDQAYRDLAVAEFGTSHLTPKQARALARKVRRLVEEAHFLEGGRSVQQDVVRRIRASGLDIVGPRQLLRILPEKKL